MKRFPSPWASPMEAILYITLALILIGTVNIFSASFVLAGQLFNDSYFFLKRHLIYLLVGLVPMVIAMKINYRRLTGLLPVIILATAGMLAAVHFGGVDANGAKRWLVVGIKFQPSEIAKLAAVIIAAAYLGPRLDRNRFITLWSWPVLIVAAMGFLVLKQPDMGTASVIVGLCLLLYLVAGIPKKQFIILGALGSAGIACLIYAASYRAERILAWLDPWAYQQTSGYQAVQSLLAIGSGGMFGAGLGMGASKFHYLPEAHTDFAYAMLCQEMGFIGAVAVIVLLAAFAWFGVKIAILSADGFGRMLAIGTTALISVQGFGNIAMVSGIFPVTGVPLPFISYGGTSLIVSMTAVGLLISVGRYSVAKGAKSERKNPSETRRRLHLVTH